MIGRTLLFCCCLFLTGPALPADNPAQADDNQDIAQQEPATGNDQPDANDGSDNAEQDEEEEGNTRFIPTEEISQDLGVSFPVDI